MKQKRTWKRSDRVGQNMLEVLASLILLEVKDPRVSQVQLTAVDVSPDLSFARVFYVMLDRREADADVQHGLERSSGFLRRELGVRLSIRHVPELRFVYDASVERGRRIDDLLSTLTPAADEGTEDVADEATEGEQ